MTPTANKRRIVRVEVSIRIEAPPPPRRRWNAEQEYRLDVRRAGQGEHSVLATNGAGEDRPESLLPVAV